MINIKQSLRQVFIVQAYLKRKRVAGWIRNDRPIPVPHDVKQITIQYYAIAYKLDILVETGTYLGDMVWAQKRVFKKIYSIELSEQLYLRAKKRFRNDDHIRIMQGDSSEEIGKIMKEIKSPALFWLDGHYSGGITARGTKICPIYAELDHVLVNPYGHVILIDDARLFVGKDDYPSIDELKKYITDKSAYKVQVENDIIVLTR